MYKSILDMAEGAIKERCDIEMSKIIDNIMDINTAATKARELKLTVKFTPSSDRKMCRFQRKRNVNCNQLSRWQPHYI